MAAGNRHLGYKATLNELEARSPGPRRRSTSASSSAWRRCSPTHRAAETAALATCAALRRADDRRGVRVLPPRRGGRRPRAGPGRDADGGAAADDGDCPSAAGWPAVAARTRSGIAVSGPLELGERVLLLDAKRRRYLVVLSEGGEFHSHAGFVPHADIVGRRGRRRALDEGRRVHRAAPDARGLRASRCRAAPRSSIPKDLAPICMLADIGPGQRVFETGVGSGALSMTMLRWGADIVGYELREDFANRARPTCAASSATTRSSATASSCATATRASTTGRSTGSCSTCPSRGRSCPHAERVLHAGGILVAYTPSITQAAQAREALQGRWIDARTIEVLHRGWHIEGQAVRPDHRMVAHTGFLTVARFLGRGLPSPRRLMRSATRPPVLGGRPLPASGLDVDALAGALLGGLDHGVELAVGDVGQALGALRVALGRGVDLAPSLT